MLYVPRGLDIFQLYFIIYIVRYIITECGARKRGVLEQGTHDSVVQFDDLKKECIELVQSRLPI